MVYITNYPERIFSINTLYCVERNYSVVNNVILHSVSVLGRDWAVGRDRFYSYSCSVSLFFRKCRGQKYCILCEQE